ncbi:MAG: putative DNA modification/repair radical SAM protein [Coriobacteriia bacterium]|nr:putative DNA modification/repair radical SAM protein [Coriobacteriia bacterium]
MNIEQKLEILTGAAKYDAACTSSGVNRSALPGQLGNACSAGICHSFSADGRCIALLKVLMSNDCKYNCAYCTNRVSKDQSRASFEPRELADLVIEFYRRNYIEGLFLSSGVSGDPDYATARMIAALSILRNDYGFNGYIHAKGIPGASPEIISQLGYLVDRLSINIEMPSSASLQKLAPDKNPSAIFAPMGQIRDSIGESRQYLLEWKGRRESRNNDSGRRIGKSDDLSALRLAAGCSTCEVRGTCTGLDDCMPAQRKLGRPARFAPAGQATQMIIGASPDSDYDILRTSVNLYDKFNMKRVFYSAYVPVGDSSLIQYEPNGQSNGSVQLVREHRLYQSDWLLRFYNFELDELLSPDMPHLDPLLDPKCLWALRNLDRFPIEVNRAPIEELVRVPGIGPTGAQKIVRARRSGALDFSALAALRIVLKRAQWFITAKGKYREGLKFEHQAIYQGLTSEEARKRSFQQARKLEEASRQLVLF